MISSWSRLLSFAGLQGAVLFDTGAEVGGKSSDFAAIGCAPHHLAPKRGIFGSQKLQKPVLQSCNSSTGLVPKAIVCLGGCKLFRLRLGFNEHES
jgi:hypothetical protein